MDPDVDIAELPQQPTQRVGVTVNVANGIVFPFDQGPSLDAVFGLYFRPAAVMIA